jgi:Ca-activated chloride channel family protein
VSLRALALAILLLAAPASAGAAPGPDAPRRVTEGILLWRSASQPAGAPAPLLATDVDLRVSGLVARATVRQEFTNPAPEWAEGIYVFPLPEDAAVDRLRLRVGERIIEGAEARRTYEQARRQGQRTGLVEQERPNVFTTSVANIPPGAAVTVEIEYQQTVRYEAGQFRLRFPLVVGPRYIPGTLALGASGTGWAADTDEVPDASRITPPVSHPSRGPINPVTLRVALDPGLPLAGVRSSSHAVQTTALPGGRYEVTLQQGTMPADRDFELAWEPAAGAAPSAVLLTEARGDEVHALLMVLPPAPAAAPAPLPREAIFVVDRSGSMAGASIVQARAALRLALGRLGPADRFNVVWFNHQTGALFQEAREASAANLALALRHVDGLRAEGGTEILPALVRALDGGEHPGRVRQVVFLTDGSVGDEARLFAAIRARLGDSRLFTVGIGSAPNGHFMREAARAGRGSFTYVSSAADVQARMTELFARLESPALTELALELPGAGEAEVLPSPLPDLYAGEPLVVALRTAVPPTRALLRGRLGAEAWESDVPLHDTGAGSGLAAHWARQKIAALLDRRSTGVAEADVRHAVLDLALRHGLVSPYTSLVAVDVTPARPDGAPLASHAMATNLPAGWSYEAVFGAGQGATGAALHLTLGLAALAAAAALRLWQARGAALATGRWRRAR